MSPIKVKHNKIREIIIALFIYVIFKAFAQELSGRILKKIN
jgi:hypothetical protein